MAQAEVKHVTLALQGGGAHGAFAWGAVDRLLHTNAIALEGITAASGGALSAVVLADGYVRGGPEEACRHLKAFWKKVSVAANMLPIRPQVVDKFLSDVGLDFAPGTMALDFITKLFSPYQFNLFDLNPLRGIVGEMVDFERLRAQKQIKLYINATHAKSGRSRVFREHEISLEAVMASCCLPYLFRTVEVDGEPYWDGGFSGSPALYPLLEGKKPQNVLLVATLPFAVDEVPTKAADILDRAAEVSFVASFHQELRLLEAHNAAHPQAEITVHAIEASDVMASLGRASKLSGDWDFLLYLYDLGVQAAQDWMEDER